MASILSQAMTRIADMQIEALAGVTIDGSSVEADAVPYFPYQQEAAPYFSNRITNHEVTYESDDIVTDTFTITMRLVIGHLEEGYDGELASDMYEYIPAVIAFFDSNPFLTSTNYPAELDYIEPEDVTITVSSGINAFLNSGVGSIQIGTEFTLEVPLLRAVY
jgi:hypothetical protein